MEIGLVVFFFTLFIVIVLSRFEIWKHDEDPKIRVVKGWSTPNHPNCRCLVVPRNIGEGPGEAVPSTFNFGQSWADPEVISTEFKECNTMIKTNVHGSCSECGRILHGETAVLQTEIPMVEIKKPGEKTKTVCCGTTETQIICLNCF